MKRGQGFLALVVAGAAFAGGAAAHDVGVATPPQTQEARASSGAWFCPHGGGAGWQAALEIANPGASSVEVRVTSFGPEDASAPEVFYLDPGSVTRVVVPATDRGSSSMVEYFGGWVGAGWVTQAGGEESGVAAEPCTDKAGGLFYLPDGTTARGQQGYVVVMNPFGAEAVFTLSLQTGNEKPVTTSDLSDYVLKPRHSVAFHINHVALEDTVAVVLTTTLGRVSAASLGIADAGGIRSVEGIATPSPRWILPGGQDTDTAAVAVMNTSEDRALVSATLYTDDAEQTAAGAQNQEIDGGRASTFSVITSSPSAIDLRADFGEGSGGVVAVRRTFGINGDQGATAGAASPAKSWVVLPAVADPPYDVGLLISNPGSVDAVVNISLLGEQGVVLDTPPVPKFVTVPPHRTVLVPTDFTNGSPLDAMYVVAAQGAVVPVVAGYSSAGASYAVSAGIPAP
jgi:hypothetical protein